MIQKCSWPSAPRVKAQARIGGKMPSIRREGPYRFFFYSSDQREPTHVHVERDWKIAKFWLEPVRLQSSGGFRPSEIRRITAMIMENEALFVEAWNEYFDS